MSGFSFEALHEAGRQAVLSGKQQCEALPQQSGRWGHSVVSILDGDAAASLDGLTQQASALAGPGHWESGRVGRAHVTIRALQPYSDDPADPAVVSRTWSAFEQVFVAPVRLSLDGLLLAPAGVMVRCTDLDGEADTLRSSFGHTLGADGWFEDHAFATGRDPIWYCTILHFVGPVTDPQGLVEWVDERSELDLGEVRLDTFSLCRWDLDEHGMAPSELRRLTLSSPGS